MLSIISVYDDTTFRINKDQNGDFTFAKFNAASRLAENRLLDYLSGDIENQRPPIPYLSQKNRDWLAPLIEPKSYQVNDGIIVRPTDYYGYENMFRIGGKVDEEDCDDDDENDNCNTKIELVSTKEFNNRCTSDIDGLKPSMNFPIAKEVGTKFYISPQSIGSITLEYIRYPKYGYIVTKKDLVYNDEVPDTLLSQNYEHGDNCRDILVWLITQEFGLHIREQALMVGNQATGKLIRDQK